MVNGSIGMTFLKIKLFSSLFMGVDTAHVTNSNECKKLVKLIW